MDQILFFCPSSHFLQTASEVDPQEVVFIVADLFLTEEHLEFSAVFHVEKRREFEEEFEEELEEEVL